MVYSHSTYVGCNTICLNWKNQQTLLTSGIFNSKTSRHPVSVLIISEALKGFAILASNVAAIMQAEIFVKMSKKRKEY